MYTQLCQHHWWRVGVWVQQAAIGVQQTVRCVQQQRRVLQWPYWYMGANTAGAASHDSILSHQQGGRLNPGALTWHTVWHCRLSSCIVFLATSDVWLSSVTGIATLLSNTGHAATEWTGIVSFQEMTISSHSIVFWGQYSRRRQNREQHSQSDYSQWVHTSLAVLFYTTNLNTRQHVCACADCYCACVVI